MINVDLRKESPQNNVNRILAIESLVKYYAIDLVEEIDPRVVHSWIEINPEDDQEIEVKQINLAYVLFGMPTPELRYLMEKLNKKVLKEDIVPIEKQLDLSAMRETPDQIRETLNKLKDEQKPDGGMTIEEIRKQPDIVGTHITEDKKEAVIKSITGK